MNPTFPTSRYMEICLGIIGMRPTDFWNSSPIEIYKAIEGFVEFNIGKNNDPMSRDELDYLMELYPD